MRSSCSAEYRVAGALKYAFTFGAAAEITHLPLSCPGLYFAFNASSVVSVTNTTSPRTRPFVPGLHADGVPRIGNA
jgi:hypothetical protein